MARRTASNATLPAADPAPELPPVGGPDPEEAARAARLAARRDELMDSIGKLKAEQAALIRRQPAAIAQVALAAANAGSAIPKLTEVLEELSNQYKATLVDLDKKISAATAELDELTLSAQRPHLVALWDRLVEASRKFDDIMAGVGPVLSDYRSAALELSMRLPQYRNQLRSDYRIRAAVPDELLKALGVGVSHLLRKQMNAQGCAGLADLSVSIRDKWLRELPEEVEDAEQVDGLDLGRDLAG